LISVNQPLHCDVSSEDQREKPPQNAMASQPINSCALETCVQQLVELLKNSAVDLTFTSVRPQRIAHQAMRQPSSCTFWRVAAEGRVFYTEAHDHFGCPVSSYILGAELPSAPTQELTALVTKMVTLGYVNQDEIAALPRLTAPPRFITFAPLAPFSGSPPSARKYKTINLTQRGSSDRWSPRALACHGKAGLLGDSRESGKRSGSA